MEQAYSHPPIQHVDTHLKSQYPNVREVLKEVKPLYGEMENVIHGRKGPMNADSALYSRLKDLEADVYDGD